MLNIEYQNQLGRLPTQHRNRPHGAYQKTKSYLAFGNTTTQYGNRNPLRSPTAWVGWISSERLSGKVDRMIALKDQLRERRLYASCCSLVWAAPVLPRKFSQKHLEAR